MDRPSGPYPSPTTSPPPHLPSPPVAGPYHLPLNLLLTTNTLISLPPAIYLCTMERDSLYQANHLLRILSTHHRDPDFHTYKYDTRVVMNTLYTQVVEGKKVKDVRAAIAEAVWEWRVIERKERDSSKEEHSGVGGAGVVELAGRVALQTPIEDDKEVKMDEEKEESMVNEVESVRETEDGDKTPLAAFAEMLVAKQVTFTRVGNLPRYKHRPAAYSSLGPSSKLPISRNPMRRAGREDLRKIFIKDMVKSNSIFPLAARADLGISAAALANRSSFQSRVEKKLASGRMMRAPGLESYYYKE